MVKQIKQQRIKKKREIAGSPLFKKTIDFGVSLLGTT